MIDLHVASMSSIHIMSILLWITACTVSEYNSEYYYPYFMIVYMYMCALYICTCTYIHAHVCTGQKPSTVFTCADIRVHVHVNSESTGVYQSDLEVVIHPECLVESEQAEG